MYEMSCSMHSNSRMSITNPSIIKHIQKVDKADYFSIARIYSMSRRIYNIIQNSFFLYANSIICIKNDLNRRISIVVFLQIVES